MRTALLFSTAPLAALALGLGCEPTDDPRGAGRGDADTDNEVVPYDEECAEGIGWTWTDATHTAVEFCEEACAELQGGEVETISALFGCPTQVL